MGTSSRPSQVERPVAAWGYRGGGAGNGCWPARLITTNLLCQGSKESQPGPLWHPWHPAGESTRGHRSNLLFLRHPDINAMPGSPRQQSRRTLAGDLYHSTRPPRPG